MESSEEESKLPKISVITPSLNQRQFVEETIRSVIFQRYPNLEYLVIDGCSTDGTVEIIRKYEPWIDFWCSEKDNGQVDAINRGLAMATGDVVAWLNSDDYYLENALHSVGKAFQKNPSVDFVYGDINIVDENGEFLRENNGMPFSAEKLLVHKFISQPACFWRKSVMGKIGYLDDSYINIFDVEYWIRAGLSCRFMYLPEKLAEFRVHSDAKTHKDVLLTGKEGIALFERFFDNPSLPVNIRSVKKSVLQHWNERLGRYYFERKNPIGARHYLVKAIKAYPLRLQNCLLVLMIIDTIFKTKLYESYCRKRKRFSDLV